MVGKEGGMKNGKRGRKESHKAVGSLPALTPANRTSEQLRRSTGRQHRTTKERAICMRTIEGLFMRKRLITKPPRMVPVAPAGNNTAPVVGWVGISIVLFIICWRHLAGQPFKVSSLNQLFSLNSFKNKCFILYSIISFNFI